MVGMFTLKKYRFEIWLFILYTLLALVVTYPLVLNLNNSIYGIRGDHLSQLWQDWWEKEQVLAGKFPVSTPLANYPFEFSYEGAAFPPLHLGLRLILTLLTNEVLSLNIWLLLSFPLSGLAVYLLVKHLTKNRLSGALSGLVYSFSMYQFSHAWEHSSLVFIFWMPFYVLALVRFNEEKSIRRAIVTALWFSLVLLDNFYYGYMIFLFTAVFFLLQVRSWISWRSVKLLVLFAFFCAVFSAPFIFPIVKGVLTGNVGGELPKNTYQRSPEDLNWMSARPWFYVLPSPYHLFLGNFSRKILDWIATKPPYFLTTTYARIEHNLYLGWTALLLAVVAVFQIVRRKIKKLEIRNSKLEIYTKQFLLLGVLMIICSAPPMATVAGLKIYFPSHFLYKIFPMFRAYARFGVLVLLCVSVLAGFGLSYVFSVAARFYRARSWRHKMPQLLTVVLSGAVLLEVLLPPYNVDLTPPEAYLWLAEQQGDFVIMEYPPRSDHTDLLYQRVHRKKMFDIRTLEARNLLCSLVVDKACNPKGVVGSVVKFPDGLREVGVKYIIFHKDGLVDRGKGMEPIDPDYFDHKGFEVVEEFDTVVIYTAVGEVE